MTNAGRGLVAVTGATGLQGGAVARRLRQEGWPVRGLTRNAAGAPARALAALGIEVVQADMGDAAALGPALAGAYGLYSVQNPYISGAEAEVRQGKNVADTARAAGVQHVVYGSAGVGRTGTGIASWETKRQVETHMQALGLPLTILRPMAFMELMTHRQFYPAIATWQVMPRVMGASRPVGWLCTEDLGVIAARVFADPGRYIGGDLSLASDVQTIRQCQASYHAVLGRSPRRLPVPPWLFARFGFVGRDLTAMWRWLRTAEFSLDTAPTLAIHPGARGVKDWLAGQHG